MEEQIEKIPHIPVLAQEVLSFCEGKTLHSVLDGTLGFGGHAELLLKQHPEIVTYTAFDQDQEAIRMAKTRLQEYEKKMAIYHTNFSSLPNEVAKSQFDLILLDIGVSSMQLDIGERGFSFMKEGPLDMRMDQTKDTMAKDIVNSMAQKELEDLFFTYGEEPRSRAIAKAICEKRKKRPFTTTQELVACIETVSPRRGKTHPATRVFQALRIAVNEELQCLEKALSILPSMLSHGGRIMIITFHSMEDRIVKHAFQKYGKERKEEEEPLFHIITKKPIDPSFEEIRRNKRARSAKLRVLERV